MGASAFLVLDSTDSHGSQKMSVTSLVCEDGVGLFL